MKIFLFGVLFCSQAVLAGQSSRVDAYFRALKSVPANYSDFGFVCEQAAVYELGKQYDSNLYEIVNGITYRDHNHTIGELDLVVFDKAIDRVVAIGEVKCWNNSSRAVGKAHNQLERFQNTMEHPEGIYLTKVHGRDNYKTEQFLGPITFFTYGPLGSSNQGFDYELNMTIDEAHELYLELVSCQQRGECPILENENHNDHDDNQRRSHKHR